MKTKYLFCACQGEITPDTVFVDVYVGAGLQDQRDLQKVSALAASHLFYFKKWSNVVQAFYDKIVESLTPGEAVTSVHPQRVSMSVRELRRRLLDGTYFEFCAVFVNATRGLRRMNFSHNSAILAAKHRASQVSCKSAHVKNLSQLKVAV